MKYSSYILPEIRRGKLKSAIQEPGRMLRIIEAHNGLSAKIGETTKVNQDDKNLIGFDGLWVSSLTCSAAHGLPDMEIYALERRIESIEEILHASTKPIIVDGDTGGESIAFDYLCRRLESLGVSAVVIEDKKHPKRNSLSQESSHVLENPFVFGRKIQRAKATLNTDDFMIFARLESLIAGQGVDDAIERARIYLDSGADGVMIHSKEKVPDQIFDFLDRYNKIYSNDSQRKPVICVPTTYNHISAEALFSKGVRIVIHANHLLRAAHYAMTKTCESILRADHSSVVDNYCTSIKDIFKFVGYDDALARDHEDEKILLSRVS